MMFMATKILYTVSQAAVVGNHRVQITRAVEHDLESFYWVILYVAYRRTLEDQEQQARDITHAAIRAEFNSLFFAPSTGQLAEERQR